MANRSSIAVAMTIAGAATALTLAWRKAQRHRVQVVAVLLPEGPKHAIPLDMLLPRRPEVEDAEVLTGSAPEDFGARLDDITAITWIPGARLEALAALYTRSPGCRWVHAYSAGVDGVAGFVASLPAHVRVSNGRGAFSSSLGEYVLTAALHFSKQVPRCIANREARRWDKFVMAELRGKTMGFVGFGSIAQAAAKLAAAFGMRSIALRRNPELVDELAEVSYGLGDAEAFYAQSDFVVSTLPATSATRKMIGRAAFKAMRRTAVFISLGRGAVVDEDALAAALTLGPSHPDGIAAAALDVFDQEPLPERSPLWACDNLLVTAHNADFTESYVDEGWRVWRENLLRVQAAQPLATPVDKQAGY